MDDATLNPQPDGRQAPGIDLQEIVERLARTLGRPDSPPQPLDGGITNRNFRARFAGVDYVIRVPGKNTTLLGIDREAERFANERAAAAGVAPAVAAMLAEPQCIVTRFVVGEGLEPADLRRRDRLAEVARALRAIHELDEPLRSSFDSFRVVERYAATARERGGSPPPAYGPALERARAIEAALAGPEHVPVPCHNDLLAANFIAERPRGGGGEERLWIVDWEYAGMGDRYFDLANFAVNNELTEGDEEELLTDYFGAPPGERQLATLRLMRFMSDFREAMWGVVQGTVSELDFDFAGYAARHFDRMLATAADPRFAGWLRSARGPAD
jgi:thiamine kinase-like enzyme